MRLLLPVWFLAGGCASAPDTGLGDTGDTGDVPLEGVDADGDGFPAWSTTADDARADCDDADPAVTPETERYVRAGPFVRGEEGTFWAEPVRSITLSDYCIDRTEVTNDAFLLLLEAREAGGLSNVDDEGRTLFDVYDADDPYPERIVDTDGVWSVEAGYGDHPVVEVWPWSGELYCATNGKALPTEAQWEKAARGEADARIYPWGDDAAGCSLANYVDVPEGGPPQDGEPCVGDTAPVGGYPDGASPYGAVDLAGNVAEWVQDWFDPEAYAAGTDTDPTGPAEGALFDDGVGEFVARTSRGGNFLTAPEMLHVSARTPEPETATSNGVGFRCARPL
jgi:formylglycine-generating enzyme required for sulfatase activity